MSENRESTRYQLIKQEGEQIEVMGETAIKHDLKDVHFLVMRGDITEDELVAFKKEIDKYQTKTVLAVLPNDVEFDSLRIEQERSTAELTEELSKREGVEEIFIGAHEPYKITVAGVEREGTGPATILINID